MISERALLLFSLCFGTSQSYSLDTYNRYVNKPAFVPATPMPIENRPNSERRASLSASTEYLADINANNNVPPSGSASFVGEKYVLDGDPMVSSGKSAIYEAYPYDEHGNPMTTEDPVIVKLSANTEQLEREAQNYERISANAVDANGQGLFVEVHDYIEQADPNCSELKHQAALVMEKGDQDLKAYLEENGHLEGQQLRDVAKAVAECVQAVHNSEMVWTEIKGDNFVVTSDAVGTTIKAVKGIDLESAVPHLDNPIDYTPKACPPEFAVAFLCGREPFMEMDYKFDKWSLGMLFYKMTTGRGYFDEDLEDSTEIANVLRNAGKKLDLNKNGDEYLLEREPDMKDLIERCLALDPRNRPSLDQILQHDFFVASA